MNTTTKRFPRTLQEAFGLSPDEAVAIHKYNIPLHRRFFYALCRWGWVYVPVVLAVLALSGCADNSAEFAQATELEAVQQEEAAKASREWAGQQVCGPSAEASWLDDKTLVCTPKRGRPFQVAGVK